MDPEGNVNEYKPMNKSLHSDPVETRGLKKVTNCKLKNNPMKSFE